MSSQRLALAYYYRPQTKFAKVMFLHLSVILFTGGSTWAGTPGQVHPPGRYTPQQVHPHPHPLGRYTPWAGTSQAGTPPGQVHPLGRYTPPWAGTPPGKYTPPGRYTPRVGIPLGRYTLQQVNPPPRAGTPSPRQCMLGYGQQAGGTHPTGMHSCL